MNRLADILIVIDLQVDVCNELWNRENLIKQINSRISNFRDASKPILFIQHNDEWLLKETDEWQLVDELDARETDFFTDKEHANGFYQTSLGDILTNLHVESIEFCGAETPYCINSTLIFAHGLGYHCQMQHGATSCHNLLPWMTAEVAVDYYEKQIWDHRFLEFVD